VLQEDAMILAIGKAEQNGDSLKVMVNEVYPMEAVREKFAKSIILSIKVDDIQSAAIEELRKVAERYKGKYPCFFTVQLPNAGKPVMLQSTKYSVGASDEFIAEVEKILGPKSVRIST
jgi:hypothetical protein